MVWARTCILGAAGILALYGYGVTLYGVFHLTDYPMFLGIAAYMALTSSASARLRALRMPILYATVCASLMGPASRNGLTRSGPSPCSSCVPT